MTGDRRTIVVAGREIGPGEPVYVVAELSANHLGDLGRARAIVEAAAEAKVDAVKLQTYTADSMTLDVDDDRFRVSGGTTWDGRHLHELYGEAATPWAWHGELMALCAGLGLHCFSTPFDPAAVDRLETLDVPAYKIASFELVDIPLIEHAAATGKPLIVSTGMATVAEIDEAVQAATTHGDGGVALLRCNSSYPARFDELDLRTIPAMATTWGVPVGLSDHTLTASSAIAAVALGACIVEKHLTLRRSDGGPDAAFSLEPDELAALVAGVREVESALGQVRFGPSRSELASVALRRSLFVVEDVAAGDELTSRNVRALRPADGLPPEHLRDVLGRRARCDLPRGTPLGWEHLR